MIFNYFIEMTNFALLICRTQSTFGILLTILAVKLSVEALDIKCKTHRVEWMYVSDSSRVLACYDENLAVTSRESVTNVTLRGYSYDDVKIIGIAEQICHFIPQNFDNFMKNVEGLSISQSHLKEIKKDDFRQFPNIIELKFVKNDIKELDNDLFEYTPNLKFLSLDFNKIIVVGLNTFDNVPLIKGVYVKRNNCIDKRSDYQPETSFVIDVMKQKCVTNNARLRELSLSLLITVGTFHLLK